MKRLIISIALSVMSFNSVYADEACQTEFRDLLQQKHEGYPYKGKTITQFGEQRFEGVGTMAGAFHSYGNDPKTGISTLFHGLSIYQSSDGEKTWRKISTMPADTEEKAMAMHIKQSKSTSNVSCLEAEEYKGETYRTVQGTYISGSTKDHEVFQKYYMKGARGPDAVWWIRISENTLNGQKSIVIHEKISMSDGIEVPTID